MMTVVHRRLALDRTNSRSRLPVIRPCMFMSFWTYTNIPILHSPKILRTFPILFAQHNLMSF